jgi:hypothetical protein
VPFIPEPLTSSRVAAVTNALTVRDVMATGVTALPPVVEASRLVDLLKRHKYAVGSPPSCKPYKPGCLCLAGMCLMCVTLGTCAEPCRRPCSARPVHALCLHTCMHTSMHDAHS